MRGGEGQGECESTTPPPLGSPRLSVLKVVVNDDGGAGTTASFQLRVGTRSITSGTVYVLSAGTYQISEATTTVTVGTTTVQYVQSFSGDCNSSGQVTLSLGDSKVCVLTNNDAGPGTTGGNPPPPPPGGGSTDTGPGGGGTPPPSPPSGGSCCGGGSPSPSPSPSGGSGGSNPSPPGIVAGTTTPPYMGGYIPEVPNTGAGGTANSVLLALVISLATTLAGAALLIRFRRKELGF